MFYLIVDVSMDKPSDKVATYIAEKLNNDFRYCLFIDIVLNPAECDLKTEIDKLTEVSFYLTFFYHM